MPSPFPGMDPFLEDPEIFPNLHERFVTYLGDAIQAVLPEPYFAANSSRVLIEFTNRFIGPDVPVLKPENGHHCTSGQNGSVALESSTRVRPLVVRTPQDETREAYLEIYTRQAGKRRLVTAIEVLSPSNKSPGAARRKLYRRKQREVLSSQVNLVEIDLLRAGRHTTAVPLEQVVRRVGTFQYHVCVHAFHSPGDFLVYPFHLRDKLPDIAIPLIAEEEFVVIDLQIVFNQVYDTGPYRRWGGYQEPVPAPALSPEDSAWVQQQLQQQSLIP